MKIEKINSSYNIFKIDKKSNNNEVNNLKIKSKKDLDTYYHYIDILINDKKIDKETYNIVKDYDVNKLLNNRKYLQYLRSYIAHSSKYKTATDNELVNFLLTKINNQISKGQFADNLNYYSQQRRYYSKRYG